MTLLRFFLILILKGILADENVTTPHSTIQLWRAQGDFSEEVIDEFYERARFTEDIWKRDENTIDFLIDESEIPYMTSFLDLFNVSHKVLMKDFDGKVDDAMVKSIPFRRSAQNALSGDSWTWTAYPSLGEINRYLARMASKFPAYCSVTSIGRTAHNTPINMLKITNGNKGNAAILVDGGIHGSEWASVISALYFIDSVVNNYTKQPEYFKKFDWYVIPVLNPDGYEYSLTKDHLWKKNRRRFGGDIYGVDLNRNFDYDWCQKGSSQIVSNPYFCGPEPFSEEETRAFKRLVDGKHFNGYISIHSSGTKVIYPWTSNDADSYILNKHRQFTKEMGLAMSKIARNHFTNGNAQSLGLAHASGMAIDWMFFVKEIQHSYMIETRGHVGPSLLDPKEILPAAKEVRAGIFRFAEIL